VMPRPVFSMLHVVPGSAFCILVCCSNIHRGAGNAA
jgi:hypothetical protein